MAPRKLTGKRAVVTGCSSGIGKAIALQLAKEGVNVVATARRGDRLTALQEACAAFPGKVRSCPGDITDGAHQDELVSLVNEEWGSLDILVNNAGVGAFGAFRDSKTQTTRQMFDVNYFAAADLTRRFLTKLANGHDSLVVNVGSVLGHFPVPLKAEYCATKFALRAFTDAIRMEIRAMGIDVLLVSPSTTESEFFDRTLSDTAKLNWKRFGSTTPEDVARRTVSAMQRRKRELFVGKGARSLTLAYRWFPRLAEFILQRDARHISTNNSTLRDQSPPDPE